MADEYINKKDVVNLGVMMQTHLWTREQTYNAIFCLPTADVAPVRHGRWVKHGTRDRMTCSCCGDYWEMGLEWTSDNFKGWFKFCPNCGAKMDGGDGSGR